MQKTNTESLYQSAIQNFSFIGVTDIQAGVMKSGFRNVDEALGGLTLA